MGRGNGNIRISWSDRRAIPQTITFHQLWINLVRGHAFNLLTPQKIQDATKGMSNQLFKMKGSTSMDSLMTLEGTIQHEVCQKKHLLSLGFAHKTSVFIWANLVDWKIPPKATVHTDGPTMWTEKPSTIQICWHSSRWSLILCNNVIALDRMVVSRAHEATDDGEVCLLTGTVSLEEFWKQRDTI